MRIGYKKTRLSKFSHYTSKLIQLFEQQVNINPERVAIYFEQELLNYNTLNQEVNQLAHFIQTIIPGYGKRIIIYLERHPKFFISLLAILKANHTYIPVDINAPEALFNDILMDSEPALILTESKFKLSISEAFSSGKIRVINLDLDEKNIRKMSNDNLVHGTGCESAYILYTSGTTGKPKGVEITHGSLDNLIGAMKKEIAFDENDILLAITPITFDLSVPDIYLPLISGASIVLASTNTRFNPHEIVYCIAHYAITVMQATPTTWQMLIENGWKNESKVRIISGGEALPVPLAKKLKAISDHVWNFYGPTETTVWSTCYKIDTVDETHPNVSIGQPIANTDVYVLNEALQPQPAGVPGELYIGGAGVAVGYLNRPELNATSFIEHPFSQDRSQRLYKTGDLVVQDTDGQLHYLGRIDTQIKLRGHRIEAAAIENALMDCQGIKECVVLDKSPEQHHELVAYLILSDENIILSDLQEALRARFPVYMVPTRYVVVEHFPVTANGKIDRKNIPNISSFRYLNRKKTKSALENRYEEIILDVIQSFLQHDVDPESNFFDLGLHSMLLVNISQSLNRILNQSISVVDLFEHPTVRRLAHFLLKQHAAHPHDAPLTASEDVVFKTEQDQAIAVIGLACHVPGAESYQALWDIILQKKETIQHFSVDELNRAGVSPELYERSDYVPARGILKNIEQFDAAFFGYTPAEAKIMDPQHRVFLEQSWSALEDAGYCSSLFKGKIGVYAGMNDSTYLTQHLLPNPQVHSVYDPQQVLLGTSTHYLSTKVAYAMNLTGPSLTVNTACSTGLVSIVMACNSLINHECDMALAGAITLITPQERGYLYQELGILSPDGHCRVFDDESKGTVLSNGCGVVVLRRLSDAIRDNDHIVAVIKGWALNNDGSRKVGFTSPSVEGQVNCINEALRRAAIALTDVEYIEAHGTGTLMGDPIEVASLRKAYMQGELPPSYRCTLGSVKANIGHTDSASGTVGFIKACLVLYHKTLPPQINYSRINPHINHENSPYEINVEARPWVSTHKKRAAAVNALGFGGTNAHVILQEAPTVKTTTSKGANVLVLSAKTEHALFANAHALHTHLLKMMQDSSADRRLADAAYTLQHGREVFAWRLAISYQNYEHLLNVLASPDHMKHHVRCPKDVPIKRIIFGFVGQGAQYVRMAADLYQEHPVVKTIIDECCMQLHPDLGLDLRQILFPKTPDKMLWAKEQLRQTQYTQPALFVIEYALAKLLMTLGVNPDAMIGHSIGEYVAATLAGVISLNDALKLIALRSQLMARTTPGVMLAVPLSLDQIQSYLSDSIELAVHNAPKMCVVTGSNDDIVRFERAIQPLLASDGLSCKVLHTSHAFHSHYMDPILHEFYDASSQYQTLSPQIPYVSNVTGQWITDEDLSNKRYWSQHLRQAVMFSSGLKALNLNEHDVFIEIGPGCVLTQLLHQHALTSRPLVRQTLPSPNDDGVNSYDYFLSTVGALWLHGCAINWSALYINEIRQRCPLPTYMFDRQAYWIEPSSALPQRQQVLSNHDVLFKPTWVRDKRLVNPPLFVKQPSVRCWIVFYQHETECQAWTRCLERQGPVYFVSAGEAFFVTNEQHTVINPHLREDYLSLFKTIELNYDECCVIHTWLHDDLDLMNRDHVLAIGPYSVLYLTQAFHETYTNKTLKIMVVTRHVFSVLGYESIAPIKATMLGPCKVIPQEQDNTMIKLVDVDDASSLTSSLMEMIYAEMITMERQDFKDEIAYRGGYRWLKMLEPCSDEVRAIQQPRLRDEGVYLITGGLGGVGLAIAYRLASRYHANLILMTRHDFPPDTEWHHDSVHAEKIKKLLEIKKYASSLTIVTASVDDDVEFNAVVQSIKRTFSHLHGVIHAAGVAGGGIAQLKTIDAYEKVLRPKLDGTNNVMNCLQHEPLDLVVLISSITSMTGFPGQIDYCSANCVLDAYAHRFDWFSHPVFCVAMNWLAWRDVGMAADSTTLLMRLDETNSVTQQEACDIFERIVNSDLNQVIISKEDLNEYSIPVLDSQPQHTGLQQDSEVIEVLKVLWQQTLGLDIISIDDDFYALGGHSLLAVNLLSKIRHQLKVNVPSTTLFRVKTIRGLAALIGTYQQEKAKDSPAVIIRQGDDSKSPLFMIHPVGGTVFCYLELANLIATDRTIYAFQDPSIEAEKTLFDSIETMAAFYLKHIKTIQPHGPYYLCGASFGALVVNDIAYRLEKEHEEIHFIGLIDGWGISSLCDVDARYVKEILGQQLSVGAESHALEKQALWEALVLDRLKMMPHYPCKVIKASCILFKAQELLPEYQAIDAADNHWSGFASSVIVHMIPGDHNTMMRSPQVSCLVEALNRYLK